MQYKQELLFVLIHMIKLIGNSIIISIAMIDMKTMS